MTVLGLIVSYQNRLVAVPRTICVTAYKKSFHNALSTLERKLRRMFLNSDEHHRGAFTYLLASTMLIAYDSDGSSVTCTTVIDSRPSVIAS